MKCTNILMLRKINQKWYGGGEKEFHYNLITGLVLVIVYLLFFKLLNVVNNNKLNIKNLRKNKIISQKKFYPNPQEISKIYPSMKNLFVYLNRKRNNIETSYSTVTTIDNKKIKHLQESILVFNVEYNQHYYMRDYEVQVNGIKIQENKEITEQIDHIIMDKSNEITIELSKECKLSDEQIDIISKGIKNFKNCDENIVKYTNTIGIQKNNLTSSFSDNSIFIHQTSNFKKSRYIYIKKGVIQINRNEKDQIRSFVDVLDYENNKGLQNYNIGNEKHQFEALEIMKGIGGYNNIQYFSDIKTKQELLNLLIKTYIIMKKNSKW